jgi:hypothetical protein
MSRSEVSALRMLGLIGWGNLVVGMFTVIFLLLGYLLLALALVFIMQAVSWFALFQALVPLFENVMAARKKTE